MLPAGRILNESIVVVFWEKMEIQAAGQKKKAGERKEKERMFIL